MIGYISGTIIYSDSQKSIILTAQGVGYEIHTATPMVPNRDTALFMGLSLPMTKSSLKCSLMLMASVLNLPFL
jgi:hypothetical protein